MLTAIQCPTCGSTDRLNYEHWGLSCDNCGTGMFFTEFNDVLARCVHKAARERMETERRNVLTAKIPATDGSTPAAS